MDNNTSMEKENFFTNGKQKITPIEIGREMQDSFLQYAMSVIVARALPDVRDGLKPVHRRILYTMFEKGLTPDKAYHKCADTVGAVLGSYHPHGDASVYDALVRLAQNFSMRYMLVDGQGNFGSVDGDPPAAYRYTEARMSKIALEMLTDIHKETVPFVPNYDDRLKEPAVLPSRFPNILVNGSVGIAVGMATNIPPHNLGEVIDGIHMLMENPDCTMDELMTCIQGPDFPTGGVLVKNEEIRRGYETGRSKLSLRARVHVEDGVNGRKLLVITEIPYMVNKAAMLEKILKLSEEKKGQLQNIYDIRDESDREGMRAVIELKKDADPDKVLKVLYKYSDLQVTFGVNMVAIAEGKPVQMGLKTMLGHFIRHQKNVITRRTEYDLKQAKARAHILQGLMIAVDNLDEVIALIRSSKNPKEAKARLMERFELSDAQAQAILDMRLQRLTNLEIIALRKEYEDILKLIDRLEGILHSEKKLLAVIRKELQEIAEEFADERRTTIEKADESPLEVEEEAAAPELAKKKLPTMAVMSALYKKTPLPTRAEDDKEFADFLFMAKTDETLLIFTDRGNCYPLPVASLNEVKPKERGQLLSGVLAGLEDDEKALWMTCIRMADVGHLPDILFITRQGMVKRTAAADYDVRSKKFAAVNVKDGDRLLTVLPAASRDDLLLFTRSGLCIRFSLDSVPVQGRVAAGVRCMQVEDGDEVIWCGQLQDSDQIVLLTDRGYAKRLLSVDFEKQNRNGKGVKSFYFNKNGSNGKQLAGVVRLEKDDHLIRVQQAKSPATLVERDNVRLQGKQDRGTPLVIAVMDDVVTGAELLE